MHTVAVETVMAVEVVATAEEAADMAVDLTDILTGSSLSLSSGTCLHYLNTRQTFQIRVFF